MNTPHVTIRFGASSAALIDPPQPTDAAAGPSEAGGRKRHDTPFSFDVVFESSDDGTPQAERGGKWRVHIPFTFERIGPESQTVDVRFVEQRTDVALSFERRVPPTAGGLTLTEIRETIEVAVGVSTLPGADGQKPRSHTSFSFDVTAPSSDGSGGVRVNVSAAPAE